MMENQNALVPVSTGNGMFFDVQKFEFAQRVARVFAESTMVPDQFRNNVGNCLIALNYADRLGADPFMLMQGMCVVHGKPGLEGKLIIGMINACGRFDPIEFEEIGNLSMPKDDDDGCIAFTKDLRSGKILKGPKVDWRTVKAEGWYGKNGSKWKTMAPLMFRYRAAAYFGRVFCPDVLLGMQTREELVDVTEMRSVGGNYKPVQDDVPSLVERVKASAQDRAPNGKADAVDPELEQAGPEAPTQPDTTGPEPEPDPPIIGPETKLGDMPDNTQLKKLNAMIRERGLDRAGVKLAMCQFEVHPKGAAVFRPFDAASSKDIQLGNVQYFEQMLDELAPANLLKIRVDEYGKRVRDFDGFVKSAMRDDQNPINITHWYLLQRHQIDRLMKKNENGKSLIDELAEEALAMQDGMA